MNSRAKFKVLVGLNYEISFRKRDFGRQAKVAMAYSKGNNSFGKYAAYKNYI